MCSIGTKCQNYYGRLCTKSVFCHGRGVPIATRQVTAQSLNNLVVNVRMSKFTLKIFPSAPTLTTFFRQSSFCTFSSLNLFSLSLSSRAFSPPLSFTLYACFCLAWTFFRPYLFVYIISGLYSCLISVC